MAVLGLIVMILVGVVAFFTVTTLISIRAENKKLRRDTKRAFYAAGQMDEAINRLMTTNAVLQSSEAQQEIGLFAMSWRETMRDILDES